MGTEQRPVDANGNALYRIPEQNIAGLEARVEKLNRRAKKLGVDPLRLGVAGEEFETRRKRVDIEQCGHIEEAFPTGAPKYIEYQVRIVLVTVTGNCPRVNGWTFAATINHEEGGNILRVAPDFEVALPLKYRTVTTECEHCAKDRRRNDTYVLMSEAGEWKQVGRNCLADFLRTENPAGLAQWAEVIASLGDEVGSFEDDWSDGGGRRGHEYHNLQALLTQVACCVRQDGWCSRTQAKASFDPKQASVDQALCWFDPKFVAKASSKDRERYAASEADQVAAVSAIEWAQSISPEVTNDYLWNIRTVAHKEAVKGRDDGLAGSLIVEHKKHLERELAKKYEDETRLDEFFGEIGKRAVFTLTVMAAKDMESEYGSLTLYKFRDQEGRSAAWFSSSSLALEIGTTYVVKATPKKHDTYNGLKQTTLSRMDTYDAAAEAAQKEALKQAKKRIKKEFTCTHLEAGSGHYRLYPVPCGVTTIDVKCCEACMVAWREREKAPELAMSLAS